ncbi:MAG: DUF4136 domain-containing protein [Colwellia sp.]|nr:DUF4136 domain-containing protein [Colwellia sp.]
MKQRVIISLLLTLLTACSVKPTTHIDFNPKTNFQLLTSYQYSPETDTSIDANPIMINRIQTAIDATLIAKGLTKHNFIDNYSADLTIKVSFSQQEKQSNSSFSIGFGTARIGSHSSIGIATSVPISSEAGLVTKIIIDISDKNQAIWHGSDSYESNNDFSMTQKNHAVQTTVKRLLANFPPEKEAVKL